MIPGDEPALPEWTVLILEDGRVLRTLHANQPHTNPRTSVPTHLFWMLARDAVATPPAGIVYTPDGAHDLTELFARIWETPEAVALLALDAGARYRSPGRDVAGRANTLVQQMWDDFLTGIHQPATATPRDERAVQATTHPNPGGARPVERIDALLSELRRHWLAHPDLRLAQIVSNLTPAGVDLYQVEDDYLLDALRSDRP